MSTEDQRNQDERDIDALLRTAIGPASAARAGESAASCLDADTLAAWSEGSLARQQAQMVEAHVAACARCQAMLAAFARTEPAAEPLIEPAVADVHGGGGRSLWKRWRIGWVVPISATAAAFAIWVATPSMPVVEESRQAETDRDARRPEPAEAAAPAAPGREPSSAVLAAPTPPAASLPTRSPDQAAATVDPAPRTDSVPVSGSAAPAELAAIESAASARAASVSEANAKLAGETRFSKAEAADAASASSESELRRARESLEDRPAPPAPGLAPAAGAAGARLMAQSDTIEVGAGPNRWRFRSGSARATAEVSDSGGREWMGVSVPDGTLPLLVAGAAAGGRVCWLVGRRGTVLLTTDGVTFQRVAFPESIDLTLVSAEDARRARVATTDGRAFTTADGGATWARQP